MSGAPRFVSTVEDGGTLMDGRAWISARTSTWAEATMTSPKLPDAVATFVTEPAAMSSAVTAYSEVHVMPSSGASEATSGQSTVVLSS